MITPRWVDTRIQPIAIRDVLRYLVGAAALPADVRRSFDIGGPDVLTYRQMMHRYAAVAGLARRIIVPVPVLTPTLSSPLGRADHTGALDDRQAAGRLAAQRGRRQGARHRRATCPTRPRGCSASTGRSSWPCSASGTPRWSPGGRPRRCPARPSDPLPTDPDWAGGSLYEDVRRREVQASPAALWRVLEGIGGDRGWYSFPLAWRVRGLADRLVGGVGLRRGRRDAERVYVGETIDFWRVEERDQGRLLRLRAEMRLPGLAWLELGIEDGAGLAAGRPVRAPRRRTSSGRSSTPAGCSGTCTGGRWRPSTGWCSAGWPATSPAPPSSSSGASRSPPPRPDAGAAGALGAGSGRLSRASWAVPSSRAPGPARRRAGRPPSSTASPGRPARRGAVTDGTRVLMSTYSATSSLVSQSACQ